jgi:methylenetetrahydrofolate reductase (NADPH)
LRQVRKELAIHKPEFYSVTYGAGGVTREKTLAVVMEIAAEGASVAPHLSCIGSTRAGIAELLAIYKDAGIKRLVALRGDLPSGMVNSGEFRYASELVQFVRDACGDWFTIEVAAYPEVHPEAQNAGADLNALMAKFDAGADRAITQFFYNADAFLSLRDALAQRGYHQPLVPGIMPIHDLEKISRFAANCGTEMPRWLVAKGSDLAADLPVQQRFLSQTVAKLTQRLVVEGAPAIHFYTLNRADLSGEILATVRAV